MNAEDLAEFDAARSRLGELLAKSGTGITLEKLEHALAGGASSLWWVAQPILQAAGTTGLEILKQWAASQLQIQLEKLASGK